MNDPSTNEWCNEGLLEDLQKEYMEAVGAGDSKAFDFALENFDKADYALQALGMAVMKCAGHDYETMPILARAPALAFMIICERHSFLDVIEKEVAPAWARANLPKRLAEFDEMREEREHPEFV